MSSAEAASSRALAGSSIREGNLSPLSLSISAPASDEMCRNFLGERWLGLPRSY